ncbi:MAG: hypothetical protein ACREX4_18005, partial [Gammaproteobacteria bacterium]
MGGYGSGPRWGGTGTTNDYWALDVRRWQRDGLLTPGRAFGWQWSCDGYVVASIQVRTGADRVILTYRHRSGDRDWEDENYPLWLDWTPCNFGG